MPTARIVPLGKEPMTKFVNGLFNEFGVDVKPEPFKESERPKFSAEDESAAEAVIGDVASFWKSLGLKVPGR